MKTRSETYFLQLFGSATLRGAVEIAALSELSAIDESSIPVDVYKLAAKKGFAIQVNLTGPACGEGQLLPVSGGYRVRLRQSGPDTRRRFSLAHEIGHSYFYRDDGEGPRHVIGVLSAAERNAEEKICDLFAGALLMPSAALRHNLQKVKVASPPSIICLLQQEAEKFRVSLPALLMRIGNLELEWPPCLLVSSTFRPKLKTGVHSKLRIEFSYGFGEWSNRALWAGTPVGDVKISSALNLYDTWAGHAQYCKPGQFVMVGASLVQDGVPPEHPELEIVMYRKLMGVWKREVLHCTSSSVLYAWREGQDKTSAYVLTAIAPVRVS